MLIKPIASLLVLTLVLCGVCESANILVLHPMYAASHVLTLRALATALVEQGHQVVVIRWKDDHNLSPAQHQNITEHVLAINNTDGTIPHLSVSENASFVIPEMLMWDQGTSWKAIPLDAFYTVSAFCRSLLGRESLREDLRGQKFDIAIVDLIYNECSLAVAHDLGVPIIGYWAFTFVGGEPQYTTAFGPPSSVPLLFSHYQDTMTFSQRLFNHLLAFLSHVVMQMQFAVTNYEIQRHLPNTPHPSELLANLSGVLINSHPSVDYPRLLPPSFINVGGLQIQPTKSLPPDLEEFITGSGDAGVVLFTMGFTVNSRVVPTSVMDAFMGAFGRLKQRVLMKLEDGYPNPPSNIKIVKWLPQQDILAHPKTVLFFTHCGMHGVIEALHHGVPMVGMPVFSDQQDVLVRLQHKGVAVGVPKGSSERKIYEAVTEVLNNPRYRENALYISHVMKDHPQKPLHHALWLVNHVIKTKGAEHLKFSARHLNGVQFFGLDILAFLLCVCYVLWFHFVPFLMKIMSSLFTSSRKNKVKHN